MKGSQPAPFLQTYALGRDTTSYGSSSIRQVVTEMATVNTDRIFLTKMLSHLTQKKTKLDTQLKELNIDKRSTHGKSMSSSEAVSAQNKINSIKKELATTKKDIQYYTNQLVVSERNIKLSEQGWVHSNYTRDLFGQAGTFEEGAANYLSAPVNMRHVHAEAPISDESPEGRSLDFVRVGVMSDMRNGWVDLNSLKTPQKLVNAKMEVTNSVLNMIDGHMNDKMKLFSGLESSMKKLTDRDMFRNLGPIKPMTIGHENPAVFLEQFKTIANSLVQRQILISDSSVRRDIRKVLIQINALLGDRALQSGLYALKQIDNVEETIRERTHVLERQMIQLVQTQVLSDPARVQELVKNGTPLDLVHIGLLNPGKTGQLHSSGWMCNERVELEDMREIFKQFNEKTLVFDGTGPFLDGEIIHLPLKIEGSKNTIKLNTKIFNISPQGQMENTDLQLNMNIQAARTLAARKPDLFEKNETLFKHLIAEDIPDREKGYPMAEELLQLFMAKKGSMFVSVGCVQAKDRTGLVSDKAVIRSIVPKKDQQRFISQILSDGSAAMKIAQKNTIGRLRSLKINPFASNLTGFSSRLKAQIQLCIGMALDWLSSRPSLKDLPPLISNHRARRWSAPLPSSPNPTPHPEPRRKTA